LSNANSRMTEAHSYRTPPPYPSVLRFKHASDREAAITCTTLGSLETLPHSRGDPVMRCYVSTPGSDLPLAGKYNSELGDIIITCGGEGNHDCRVNRIRERPGAPANLLFVADCGRAFPAAAAAATQGPRQLPRTQSNGPVPPGAAPVQGEIDYRPPPLPAADVTCLRTVPLFEAGPIYIYPHGPAGM
jgi:hypothetical protein